MRAFFIAFFPVKIYNIIMKKIIPALCAALVCPVLASGCNFQKPDDSPYFFAMAADASFNIPSAIVAERQNDCYGLYGETRALLNNIERSISSSISSTYITKFNNAAAGAKVELDKTAYDVFSLAKDVYAVTDGYYNPAVYYNVIAYGFGSADSFPTMAEDLPSDEIIDKYNVLSAAFKSVKLYTENGKYYAEKPDVTIDIDGVSYSMKIDLGGIGKGFAVDEVMGLMNKHSIDYGYFTFGDSSIGFKKYNGAESDNYILGFSNPRYKQGSSGQYMQTPVKDITLSTSGDNVQYYEIDGVRYSHVIDPTTGKPVQTGIMSATVIGNSAAKNDAYTTAIMAMGKERAVEFINSRIPELKVAFTYDNGGKYEIITNIPLDEITLKDAGFTVANKLVDGKIVLES